MSVSLENPLNSGVCRSVIRAPGRRAGSPSHVARMSRVTPGSRCAGTGIGAPWCRGRTCSTAPGTPGQYRPDLPNGRGGCPGEGAESGPEGGPDGRVRDDPVRPDRLPGDGHADACSVDGDRADVPQHHGEV